MQVGRPEIAAMVGPAEAARVPVLPSSTIRFYLREGRRSFVCNVKIVQVYRYSVRIMSVSFSWFSFSVEPQGIKFWYIRCGSMRSSLPPCPHRTGFEPKPRASLSCQLRQLSSDYKKFQICLFNAPLQLQKRLILSNQTPEIFKT